MSVLDTVVQGNGMLTGTTTVTVKKPGGTTASLIGGSGNQPDWSSPETVATVEGDLQPAGAEALERAGLLGLVNAQVAYLEDVELAPETHRLYVGDVVYRVRSVERWEGGHVQAVVEVIADG